MGKNSKYVVGIILIGVFLIAFLVYSIARVQKSNEKTFYDSGYILKSSQTSIKNQSVERYYFNANQVYKTRYNDKVTFNDTNGDEVITEKENFVHYTNGSISALGKGVILDFNDIEQDPILYYSISEGQVLRKSGTNYLIQHLDKELKFTNLIWKIADNKYIVVGNPVKLVFDGNTVRTIDGYVEFEYMDNEIVKIYNQEATYQTISSKAYIELPDGIKINLDNKIVSKNNENKMSLENMVINSDDNVEIVDLDAYKEENIVDEDSANEIEDEKTDENSAQENNSENRGNVGTETITTETNNSSQTTNNNGQINQNVENNYQDYTNMINNGTNNNTVQESTTNQNTIGENTTNQNTVEENTANQNIIGENTTDQNTIGGDSISGDSTNQNSEGNINPGNIDIGGTIVDDTEEENVTDDKTVNEPKFKVQKFEVSAISLNSIIAIEDQDGLLTGNTHIRIVQNNNSKIVYDTEEDGGNTSLDISIATLRPNTDYTLSVEASYTVDEITYTKNFIYKIFRTEGMGITFEKDYCTDNTISVNIIKEKDTKIESADIVIVDEKGTAVETINIKNDTKNVVFSNLENNKKYTISLINIVYENQVISNGTEIKKSIKTLKVKPTISGTLFEIDKRESSFVLKLLNLLDPDKGIKDLRYEIYDTRKEMNADIAPDYVIQNTLSQQVKVTVDNIKIQRGVPYVYKVVATFEDNEKVIEYESEYSNIMKMDGVAFPSVRFEEENVTFERIEGNLVIEDKNNTISLDDTNVFIVTYTDSVGITNSFTSQGSLTIPVKINNLRSNETYKFSIYTRVNLQDGNPPIDECYIGGAVVQTKLPENMVASFTDGEQDVTAPFSVNFSLSSEGASLLEPQTLSGMTFSIYAGQDTSGTAVRTVKLVDRNVEPYESTLKTQFYDNSVTINPQFFEAKNSDFRESYYTLTVSKAYDYTTHENNLPIVNNTYVIHSSGFLPDLPQDLENALEVRAIRNRDKDQREDLEPATITGYEVTAGYNNSQKFAKTITYNAYDAVTKEIVKTVTLNIPEDGIIPAYTFDVLDGTDYSVQDTDGIRRGNSYYFSYELQLDLNGDGTIDTKYPYKVGGEDVILKSKTVSPLKQEPTILTYPSSSTANSIIYKYSYIDIDHVLENKKLIASINETIVDNEDIEETEADTFNTITFEGLSAGNFKIETIMRLDKIHEPTTKQIAKYYFEGTMSVNRVKFNSRIDSNRLVITLIDSNNQLKNVGAATVELITADKTIKKEYLNIDNNVITINLNDIVELMNKQITIKVYAHYDTGIIGWDLTSENYTYQNLYLNGEPKYYYMLNAQGNLVETTYLDENIYTATRNGLELILNKFIGSARTGTITLQYGVDGLKYNYDTIMQKEISLAELESDGTSEITFDKVIPGISLRNERNEEQITPELDQVTIKAKLFNTQQVVDNKIYIDLYKTDESQSISEFERTIEKNITEFNSEFVIDNLEPKKFYFLIFRTNIQKLTDTEETELFDTDFQVVGKHYVFSTLANAGINDIKVEYNPVTYNQKTIDIHHAVEQTIGCRKINYTIYKFNSETNNYDIEVNSKTSVTVKSQMNISFDANPGSVFEFDKNYRLKIEPISTYTNINGETVEVEIGTEYYDFNLKKLSRPIIAVRSSRTDNNVLQFKITVYDDDKIMENDKYAINVFNNNNEDITPEEYIGKEFSSNRINNIIRIPNADKNKAYKIVISTNLDYQNSGEDLVPYSRTYTAKALNENGISIGNLTLTKDANNKLEIIFYNSVKLTSIDQIRYSLYNTNGYAINNTANFVPQGIMGEDEEIYYIYTFDETLGAAGNYIVELQFLKDGEIVETASLEYTYVD